MSEDSAERSQPATPLRIQQARVEGELPRCHQTTSALQSVGAIIAVFLMLGSAASVLADFTVFCWNDSKPGISLDRDEIVGGCRNAIWVVGTAILPVLVVLFLIGVGSHLVQTGPWFSAQRLVPDARRLAPQNWLDHVFSLTALSYPAIGVPKILVTCAIAAACCWTRRLELMELAGGSIEQSLGSLFRLVMQISFVVAMAMLAMSILDNLIQRYSQSQRLRMTDQQVRDESKSHAIHPQISRRRDQLRLAIRRRAEETQP